MIRNILLYVAYFCLLVVLVVVIGFSFHSNKTGETDQRKAQTAQSQQEKNKQQGASKPKTSNQPSSGNGSSAQSPTNNLSNSGPGSVIAIFIGTVVISSLGFSWHQRRNLASSLR